MSTGIRARCIFTTPGAAAATHDRFFKGPKEGCEGADLHFEYGPWIRYPFWISTGPLLIGLCIFMLPNTNH